MAKRRKHRHLRLNVYRGRVPPSVPPGELLLEYFSDHELIAWRAKSQDVQAYHYLWFFELEAQRATSQQQLLSALRSVPGVQVDLAGWGRAIQYKYSDRPLSCIGSLKWVGGRFNYGIDIDTSRFTPFPALYLAQDMETGLREMHGLTRENSRAGLTASELNLCAANGVAWIAVSGETHNVFDLTHAQNLKRFADVIATFKLSKTVRQVEKKLGAAPLRLIASAAELRDSFMLESWREFPSMMNTPANSQLFGHLLCLAGFEGVLFSSTRTGQRNLALFTRQFKNSSSIVRVLNPPSSVSGWELNASTYKMLEIE